MPRPGASMMLTMRGLDIRAVLGAKLKLDFNADIGILPSGAGGGRIAGWLDQSGNNFNLAQGTVTAQPLSVAAQSDGHTCVRFDGVDDFLGATGLTGFVTGSAAYYCVWADRNNLVSYAGTLFDFSYDGTQNNGQTYLHYSTYHSFRNNYAVGSGSYDEAIYVESAANTSARLWAMRVNGTTVFTVDCNNTQVSTANGSAAEPLVVLPTQVRVGMLNAGNYPAKADIYRLIICNPQPTTAEHNLLMSYFRKQFPSMGIA